MSQSRLRHVFCCCCQFALRVCLGEATFGIGGKYDPKHLQIRVSVSQSKLLFQLQMAVCYGGGHFAKGFNQSELFIQLQMFACYGGGHFAEGFNQSELFIQLQMAVWYGGGHFAKGFNQSELFIYFANGCMLWGWPFCWRFQPIRALHPIANSCMLWGAPFSKAICGFSLRWLRGVHLNVAQVGLTGVFLSVPIYDWY